MTILEDLDRAIEQVVLAGSLPIKRLEVNENDWERLRLRVRSYDYEPRMRIRTYRGTPLRIRADLEEGEIGIVVDR